MDVIDIQMDMIGKLTSLICLRSFIVSDVIEANIIEDKVMMLFRPTLLPTINTILDQVTILHIRILHIPPWML